MPKVKVARKSTFIDMTPMSDVATLLLTFFILTTQFKGEEAITVDTPSSIAEFKVPDRNIMTISVDKEGKVYFSLDGKFKRKIMIEKVNQDFNLGLTDEQIDKFSNLPGFAVPLQDLPNYLKLNSQEMQQAKNNPGIPIDTSLDQTKNQLLIWIGYGRVATAERNMQDPSIGKPITADVAIKADQKVPYKTIKGIINALQSKKIYKYILITNLDKSDKPIED
jgi:biopolymer transport protein ExbD